MATDRSRVGSLHKRKKQPTPQVWRDLMAQMRRIRVEGGVGSRELADKIDIDLKILSVWETAAQAPHPHDWMVWLDALGLEVRIVTKTNDQ